MPMSVATISEIERDKRKVSVSELLVFAIALNTSPIDLIMPSDRERLKVAENVEPLHGGPPLMWWLQGQRPWSQFVSMEDFVDAARDPHRAMLRARENSVLQRIDALDAPVRLALSGLPRNGPLAPALQKALDRLVEQVEALIEAVEREDTEQDGG